MKIIIISAAAPPEPIVAGRVHWDIGKFLAGENNEVWLVSPYPSRPLGTDYPAHKTDRITLTAKDFYHVNVASFTCPQYSLVKRLYESLDFGIKSIRYVNRKIPRYDLIYVSSWAFIGQLLIVIMKQNKKAPLIMNVQDLYPESFFTKINSRILINLLKPLYLIDRFIADNSSHITVVSETLKNVYTTIRKTPEAKLTVLPNWQDESEFVKPVIKKQEVIAKHNLQAINGKFIYMYLGNIGPVAGVETIIKAFRELGTDDTALVIAGSGTYKQRCVELAEKLNVANIHFREVPAGLKPVVELQSISDVLLLPILPDAANSSIPSKLIAYMFSGKPIISSAGPLSETASAINKSDCGWVTKSHDMLEWTSVMREAYSTSKGRLNTMGRSGFDYAIQNYSKKEGLIRVRDLFYKLINA
jgi:glycosyltransferase involved in cell wall biosynthesis